MNDRMESKRLRVPATRPALSLFFSEADLPELRTRYTSDAMFAGVRAGADAVDREEERRFIAHEVRHNDQLFHILRLSQTAEQFAFHYLMTGDEDAAALSADAVREILKFDRWDYFLEAGTRVVGIQRASSTLIGVSLAADWLGEYLGETERTHWLQVASEKGCAACFLSLFGMRHPDQVVGWTRDESSTYFEHRPGDRADLSRRHIILNNTNLKAVPAAALAIGALATAQVVYGPDQTQTWLEMATHSLRSFEHFFQPDGSYHEGVSYANYTATQIVLATSLLQRFAREDLSDLVNWQGYAEYCANMTMATAEDPYEIVNFGDNGNPKSGQHGHLFRTAVPFWIARQFRDPRAQWVGKRAVGEHDMWSIIWYDADVPEDIPSSKPSLWHSDLDWMVARSGFESDDLVIAMRSGRPGNHEHADRNSIVVKCYGEQLVTDPYRPPYSFSDPAWMMRTTAAHSALLIDGNGHQYHDGRDGTNASLAVARVVRRGKRSGYAFWTSDATEAYALVDPDVASVTRTMVVLFDTECALVLDKVTKTGSDSALQARFFGYNLDGSGSAATDSPAFEIRRPLATLFGKSYSQNGLNVRSRLLPIPEATAVLHPFVEVATNRQSRESLLVTALVPTRSSEGPPHITIEPAAAGCLVTIRREDGMAVRVRVSDRGIIPEFAIV